MQEGSPTARLPQAPGCRRCSSALWGALYDRAAGMGRWEPVETTPQVSLVPPHSMRVWPVRGQSPGRRHQGWSRPACPLRARRLRASLAAPRPGPRRARADGLGLWCPAPSPPSLMGATGGRQCQLCPQGRAQVAARRVHFHHLWEGVPSSPFPAGLPS